jgi:hypothetical protein
MIGAGIFVTNSKSHSWTQGIGGSKSLPFALCTVLACASPSLAADLKTAKGKALPPVEESSPEVPGDDIFGFTSPSDIGKPGDSGLALENDGRFGKRDGTYRVITQKLEYSRTLTDNLALAVSVFGAYHNLKNVTVQPDNRVSYQFDGLSTELTYKVLERSARNPFGVTFSIEPRWGRIDGLSGGQAQSFGAESKLFIDAALVPEKLFWALNLNYAQGAQDVIGSAGQMVRSSTSNVSTALTYAITPSFMLGAEAKYQNSYGDYFFKSAQGHAFFFGPTLFWKMNETSALNAVYLPQISGKAQATPSLSRDLDNYERAIFRLKFVTSF